MSTFAKRLRELIDERNIPMKAISIDTKVSRQYVYRWLNGSRKPTAEHVVMLARAYNVSTDWLLGLSNRKERI